MMDRDLRRADRAIRKVANTSTMKGNKTDFIRLSGITYVILYKLSAFHGSSFSDCSPLSFDNVQLRMLISTFRRSFLHPF